MFSSDRLVILDADGTTIDAFSAIEQTFDRHGMSIGPLARFQKRRNMFKYLGGLKELPRNLRKQLAGRKRSQIIDTLTEVYREEAVLYAGIDTLLQRLADQPDVRVGVVTRNITREPLKTLTRLFERQGFDVQRFDFLIHLPLREDKLTAFRELRARFAVNPARAYACGDEAKDYLAALGSGMYPFMVSYGFEGVERLTSRLGIPAEIIADTPTELCARVINALDLEPVVGP
ncbi:MAG TPA: HAD family hydrolase [Lamprocystis sp. (in: g-proteobacteria)]|nr:HAD family hydrolase [Lamprocystis sp. (in: g-proteobacteria)]